MTKHYWTFAPSGSRRWELVLADDEPLGGQARAGAAAGHDPVRHHSGYISAELGDILEAAWYLNSDGRFAGRLGSRELFLLGQVLAEAPCRAGWCTRCARCTSQQQVSLPDRRAARDS